MATRFPSLAQDVSDFTEKKKTSYVLGIMLFVGVVSIAVILAAHSSISSRREAVIEQQHKRLALIAEGRLDVIRTWLDGLSHQGDRLIKSDLFRLYASEVDMIEGDLAAVFGATGESSDESSGEFSELAAQLPMMQNMLREFATYSGLLEVRILNRDGKAYLATDGFLPPLPREQVDLAQSSISSGEATFSSLAETDQGLELSIFVPIYPPEAGKEPEKAVGTLMMTKQVTGKIAELLSNSSLSAEGERTRLMQKKDASYVEVAPWAPGGFLPVMADIGNDPARGIPFDKRTSLSEPTQEVFSLGLKIPGVSWWVVQEVDSNAAMRPVAQYRENVFVAAGLGILALMLASGLGWWVLVGIRNRREAERLRTLAEKIDSQKRLLDSINTAVDEFITLKDREGKYVYVNDAFLKALDKTSDQVIGMDNVSLLGFDTAKRLQISDDQVITQKEKVTVQETLYIHSRRYDFRISKFPYMDGEGRVQGVVAVFRDMTGYLAAQEKNRRLIMRSMEALIRTIEAVDPYLGGHSKLMSSLSREMAKRLNLSEMDMAEIETAANLSQIGKMFIPKEILNKPGTLTSEEKQIMEQHVEHAFKVLKDIDISENVLKSIYEMNERLDGSGYPKGITREQIFLPARILGVANVFCALIRPRSYRGAKSADEAMKILRSEDNHFDEEVVNALAKVIKTPFGERLLSRKGTV